MKESGEDDGGNPQATRQRGLWRQSRNRMRAKHRAQVDCFGHLRKRQAI